MPNLPNFTMPRDAAARADANTTDFYASLSAEEREAEGIPAADAAKPEPEAKPEPAPDAPEAEPAAEPAEDELSLDQISEQISELTETISRRMAEPEPETKAEEDELLKAALAHDDPVVQGLAKRLQQAEQDLAAQRSATHADRVEREDTKLAAEEVALMNDYRVGGKPMTREHVDQVEDYLLQHPDLGRQLSLAQATRVVFPDAVRVGTNGATAAKPGAASGGKTQPVATIVDTGSSGAAPAEPWKPGPNTTMESAIKAAGERLLGVKRRP